ncbi:MAG: hypothetical protein EB829_03465 [Nitrosopumilus sp. H8]|nr:MAG: hypothetical protein EB829_03465 [Nitrosopumilus sp. H8]
MAISAVGVAVMLMVLSYQSLSDYAEYRAGRAPYHLLADAEPVFEPRLVEPLMELPAYSYGCHNKFGYDSAEHNPEDDSITITYFDRTASQQGSRCIWPFFVASTSATGLTHTQTYHVNQTFAYVCGDFDDHTEVYLYQYRGTGLFQGARNFVFVHFQVKIPEHVPCTFPDYLIHTVDIYDTSDFDRLYDLERYEPQANASHNRTTYIDPIRNAVIASYIYIDPLPVDLSGFWSIADLADETSPGGQWVWFTRLTPFCLCVLRLQV